jgi:hypothetical protein
VEAVWNLVKPRFGLQSYSQMMNERGMAGWVKLRLKSKPKKERKRRLGDLFSFWWWIWKEQNSRIFEDKERLVIQLDRLIQDEINLQLVDFLSADH